MQNAATARVLLRRLRPWVGKVVHLRWKIQRSFYQSEIEALLLALRAEHGRLSPKLRLRVEGFLGRLHREWFPCTWRPDPTYADIVADFRWWLGLAERWHHPQPTSRSHRRSGPLAEQPEELCRMLGLSPDCMASEFAASWRGFLKRNHPDLNPDQTPDERRHFARALALWRH
jgi:hypothetical protein